VTFGLIGLGNASFRAHLPAIEQLEREGTGRLVAAADVDAKRQALLAKKKPAVRTFAGAEDLLEGVRPDVVVIATHPGAHPDLAARALARGAHVLCEKPLALTRDAQANLRRHSEEAPAQMLMPVFQYRYSPTWARFECWARGARRLRLPYSLTFTVERQGIDPGAASGWRAEPAVGGMMADAGVHFLALTATIGAPLIALDASRGLDSAGNEQVTARALAGSGRVTLNLHRGAPRRHTSIELGGGGASILWSDDRLSGALGQRALLHKRVAALSNRDHVNALYVPLYRELATRLPDRSWRQARTAEAFSVGDALVALLERMDSELKVAAHE
jgi:predicted dehydrogenase